MQHVRCEVHSSGREGLGWPSLISTCHPQPYAPWPSHMCRFFCAGLQLTTEETTDTPESRHEQAQLVLAVHVMVEQLQHAPEQACLQPAGPESCRWTWLWLPWGSEGSSQAASSCSDGS